jgi:poly(A) polymerase
MDPRERTARDLCRRLREAGFRALFAGGCVRDLLLHKIPNDFDIATNALPEHVQQLFPHTVDVGAKFGTVLVITHAGPFEVTTFRSDGPYSDGRHPDYVEFADERTDAARRDFTINALFFDPATNQVLDYVGGCKDLRDGVIRTVGNPYVRFAEDYLRLMRAVRFAARFRYSLDVSTWDALCALAPNIQKTSVERVRDELTKMLTEGDAAIALRLLDASGLLHPLLPEIVAMKGVEQPPEFHPEGDVYTHTMLMLQHMHRPTVTLALGCLLHDVGKPLTQTFEDRIRFNGHDVVGARLAETICRRLRFSNEITARVHDLVANHMRVVTLPQMRESKRKRFVRRPDFPELLELFRLDCVASHRDLSVWEWIVEYVRTLPEDSLKPPPLLSGHDLIALGYVPGPVFKKILSEVEDAQLEGTMRTKEEAVRYVRLHYPRDAP